MGQVDTVIGAGAVRLWAGRSLGILWLVVALTVGGALRAEVSHLAPPFLVANDSADYVRAGVDLVATGELELPLKRTPLYAFFLAGLVASVGSSLDRIVAAQHVFGLATIVLTYLLGRMAFGPVAAAVAAVGVAINGSLLTMEHLLISEVLFTPLLLAGLASVLAAICQHRLGLWLVAGLLFGLCALCRPLGIAVLGAVLVMLPAFRLQRGTLVRATVLLVLGTTVCVVPWAVRQRLIHEQAVVNGGLGDALYSRVRRYDPTFVLRADGVAGSARDQAIRARIVELAPQHQYPREVRAVLRAEFGIGDVEADRLLRDVALGTIAHDPGRYALGTLSMAGWLARGSAPSLIDLWTSVQRPRVVQGWPPGFVWILTTDRPLDDQPAFNRVGALLGLYRDDLPSGMAPLALAPLGAAWALRGRLRSGAGVIPVVVVTQILLYVALDGDLYRYRFPLQPLITLLGAAGLALVLQQIQAAWQHARQGTPARPTTSAGAEPPLSSARSG